MRGKWSVDFTLTLDGVDHVLKELGRKRSGASSSWWAVVSWPGPLLCLPPPSEREHWGKVTGGGRSFQ